MAHRGGAGESGDGSKDLSETYDRELKDIFAVQSEIAGAVAKQLKVALLGTNQQSAQLTTAATPSNQNVEAYNALLRKQRGLVPPLETPPLDSTHLCVEPHAGGGAARHRLR